MRVSEIRWKHRDDAYLQIYRSRWITWLAKHYGIRYSFLLNTDPKEGDWVGWGFHYDERGPVK